jgi:hypothetical protein
LPGGFYSAPYSAGSPNKGKDVSIIVYEKEEA